MKLSLARTALLAAASLMLCASVATAGEPLVKAGQTVAFMGDSITQQGASSPSGYVNLVKSGLAANGVEIKIIPVGIGGHKSNDMRDRLERDVLSKKPDWMTLSCGVNDVWHGARGVTLEDYKTNINDILDRCAKANIRVMILTATQIGPKVTDAANTKLDGYNAFLREQARARNLPLADLNADMLAQQQADELAKITTPLTGDGVHMNHRGNIMMAKGVLKAFGLDDAQLAAADKAWRAIPDAVAVSSKASLSLPEFEALQTLATSKKMTVDALLAERFTATVKQLISESPAKK
jgi:lysophospholipase L1-like esterase